MGPGHARRARRGNYTVLGAMMIPAFMGFGALAIDLSWMRMASMQAQDLSDAASQAGLLTLRQTGDVDLAEDAAEAVVARNTIAAGTAELAEIQFGTWDEDARIFTATTVSPNSVRARVGRRNAQGVPYLLGRIWGFDKADVMGLSTSSSRSLHVILAIDITNSWDLRNYDSAREASVNFLDRLTDTYGPDDRFGMVHFTGAYGVEYTPMRLVTTEVADNQAMTDWLAMDTASKSGRPNAKELATRCSQHVASNTWTAGPHSKGDGTAITHPVGGCFPGMWREYSDEPGTDHSVALTMARTMFEAQPDDGAYRALIMLTDGVPNGIGAGHGAIRTAQGYVDPKRHITGPIPHTTANVKADSIAQAADMYTDLRVNTWVVSFVATDPFMETMTENGDGYFELARTAAAIIPIFEDIANSLPVAIVE